MSENLPSSESLILVAIMNQPRDLEIARVLGWYRVPLRSAPRVIAVDYLAFYQTVSFGESRWRIQYLAPVVGHELTTRRELLRDEPDHPRAGQEYFKIQLGPLVRLPEPILATKWRRITFFYTTGDLLLAAGEIQDLIVPSDQRRVLWQALRERANRSQDYQVDETFKPELDPEVLALFLGIKELEAAYTLNDSTIGGMDE